MGVFAYTRSIFWRCNNIRGNEPQINEKIKDKEVRLIGSDGYQFGVVPLEQAFLKPEESGMDLVKISPKTNPPVCKIIDYGKYVFDRMKKEKEAKKNRKVAETKEIRLSVNIGKNDLNVKLNSAKKFIDAGNKVKVCLVFKGRQIGHKELGAKVLDNFSEACEEFATTEKMSKMEGRNMVMFLTPKSKTSKKK